MTSRQDVADFLADFRAAMEYGQYHLVPRQKNLQGIVDLGLTPAQARTIIADLLVEGYVSGPEPDDADVSRDVWKFGHQVEGAEVYIKLRLAPVEGKKHVQLAKVLSFHRAAYRLKYPLREG